MANVTDLLSTFYDLLSETISPSPGHYLQFGWPGISLSPADFKPADRPTGAYDPVCAEETFSLVANIAPACNPLTFENSGYEIDDLYQILILSAVPQAADPANLAANPAYKLWSDAQYEMAQAQRGSIQDPNLFYYPCKATPVDWYTEQSATHWPTFSVSSGQVKPARNDSPFIKGAGRLLDKGVLKLRPAVDVSHVETALRERIPRVTPAQPERVPKPLDRLRAAALRSHPMILGNRATINDGAVMSRLTMLATPRTAKEGLRPLPALNRVPVTSSVKVDLAKFDIVRTKEMAFTEKTVLRRLLDVQLQPTTVGGSGFSLSFKYCMVNISRSWLKVALLSMPSWYMFGTAAGAYSSGAIENNAGMFPMLPTSFIAIRDLRITGQWTQGDLQNLSRAKYLGPFDVGASSVEQGTIRAPGLQIIGWISRLMPPLPPLAPPAP